MSPSITMTREDAVTADDRMEAEAPRSLTGGASGIPMTRSRSALIRYAHRQLRALAARQTTPSGAAYAMMLRLIDAIIQDGSATPQIGSNGEGGIVVEWLVNSMSLAIDFEDETEILISACDTYGAHFDETITAWWSASDPAIVRARRHLAQISAHVTHPISLS